MMWFVYDNGHYCGTVIAATAEFALAAAEQKFGAGWDCCYDVAPRRR